MLNTGAGRSVAFNSGGMGATPVVALAVTARSGAGQHEQWLYALGLGGTIWRRRADDARGFVLSQVGAVALSLTGGAALLAGPYVFGMDPAQHVYPATVWLLLIWSAGHVALGVIMHAYGAARRAAGHLTAAHDIDITNVSLYWHFCLLTVVGAITASGGHPHPSRHTHDTYSWR